MDDILILGAGRVGSEIARALTKDKMNVTIVDEDANRLLALQSRNDLRTVHGNAGNAQVLEQAGVTDATTIVAVTASDEVNLVACKICKGINENTEYRIARVRNPQYNSALVKEQFGITASFCPEELVADGVGNAIAHPGCLSVHRFSDGHLALAGIRISPKVEIAGATIGELRRQVNEIDYRIVSIYRDGEYMKPEGESRLFVGDEVYVLVEEKNLNELTPLLAGPQHKNSRIFIAGGGNIGERVAAAFEEAEDVKVLELKRDRCRELSQRLSRSLVLKGEATDETLLQQENIGETDIFCALTNDDEENILSAMLAKRLGAKKVAVLINRTAYVDILERQLDVVLSPSHITIGSVLSAIRSGNLDAVHSLRHGSAEAVEFTVSGDKKNSQLVGGEAGNINWPEGTTLGAIVRGGRDTPKQILIAHDNTTIEEGDHLICFAPTREAVHGIKKLIKVGLHYTPKAGGS